MSRTLIIILTLCIFSLTACGINDNVLINEPNNGEDSNIVIDNGQVRQNPH